MSQDQGDYDGTVEEISFREAQRMLQAEADMLLETAWEQLEKNYRKKGDGWQYEDPRYHFWKGQDEFFSACHAAKQGDIETMEKRMADGFNHFFMASYLAYSK